ncbi:MAG TPA: response regulator [Chloroflexota bacterium]|nr:response regulator [Chloroflexota bacterium]
MEQRKRVLVVEDDDSIRSLVQATLEIEGYDVQPAEHGGVALEIVQGFRPDVVVLDMFMPCVDGREFARQYHAMPPPHAPIIALTAAQDPADTATEIAAAGFLTKPFEIDRLLAVIDQHS